MSGRWRKTKAELRRKYGKHGILMIPVDFVPEFMTLDDFAMSFRNWSGTLTFVDHDYEIARVNKHTHILKKRI